MRKFELCIRADNFKLKKDGKVKATGFYAARGVEAESMSEATDMAMDEFKAELKPLSMNEQGDPPKFKVIEINEVYYFQEQVDIGEKIVPTKGYVWDEDSEDERENVKTPLSSWRGGWKNFRKSLRERETHVHSIAVHFTNGLYPVAILFMFLFLISGKTSFDKSYYYIMVTATICLPASYITGLLEWKRRHQGAMAPIFISKIRNGIFVFIIALACSLWRFLSPDVLQAGGLFSVLFVLLNLAILPFIIYLGHIGGIIVYEGKN